MLPSRDMPVLLIHRAQRVSIPRWFALLPSVVLLLALVVGGVHHHASDTSSHSCAICSLAHAPATGIVVVAASVPTVHGERLVVGPVSTPRTACLVSPSSRAPPSA